MEVEMINPFVRCLDQFKLIFFAAFLVSVGVVSWYVKKTYRLTVWETFRVVSGTMAIRRTWKLNLLHLVSLLFPFAILFSLAAMYC